MEPSQPAAPLSSVLVKPAGPRCNMACRYCFYLDKHRLFEGADQARMSPEVLQAMVRQVMQQGGRHVVFVWQGGEPTLLGPEFFQRALELQMRFGRGQSVGNALQTNGLLLDRRWLTMMRAYRFLVGLSIDGPEQVHDHYRRRQGGQGSHARAVRAARMLQDASVEVNALAVLNDHSVRFPDEIYGHLRELGLAHMQFIPCAEPAAFRPPAAAYGAFLCRVFDLWLADFRDGLPTTSVRNFDSLLHLYAGLPAPECTLMDRCGVYVVVEHDGGVYSCDFAVEPGWHLGNVLHDDLSALLSGARQREFGALKARLGGVCQACRWLPLCRGGCTRHRPAPEQLNHFCQAFQALLAHADGRFSALAARVKARQAAEAAQDGVPRRPPVARVGRNEPCPCGSGRKYKRCCGRGR